MDLLEDLEMPQEFYALLNFNFFMIWNDLNSQNFSIA